MKFKVAKKKREHQPRDIVPFLIGFLFVALPFVVSFNGYDKFRVPKDVFLGLGVLVLSVILLATRNTIRIPRMDLWNWTLATGLVYVGVHTLVLRPTTTSTAGFASLLYFSVLLVLVSETLSAEIQRKIWFGVGLATSATALIAVLQFTGNFPLMVGSEGSSISGRLTPAGFVGDVNSGALLFALIALLSLYWITTERRLNLRLVSALVLALNLAGLAFTQTLTALIAFMLGFLLWLVLHHWWVFRFEEVRARQLALLWGILLFSAVTGLLVAQQAGVLARVQVVARQLARGDLTMATAGRQPVYLITWQMIKEKPVLGRGLNSFGSEFYFARADTEYGQSLELIDQPGAFREVHNEYLQAWVELGFGGLLFFVGIFLIPLLSVFRGWTRRQNPQQAYWLGHLAIGVVLVAVSSLTFFPFHVSSTAAYTVLLLASIRTESATGGKNGRRFEHWLPGFWNHAWVRVVLAVALAAPLAYGQIGKWRANREIAVAAFLLEQARLPQFNNRQRRTFADEAWKRLQTAEQTHPGFYEIYNLKGTAQLLMGRYEEAKRLYAKAAKVLPSPEVFTNLASAHMSAGENETAHRYLQSALRYNPHYEPARQGLSLLRERSR